MERTGTKTFFGTTGEGRIAEPRGKNDVRRRKEPKMRNAESEAGDGRTNIGEIPEHGTIRPPNGERPIPERDGGSTSAGESGTRRAGIRREAANEEEIRTDGREGDGSGTSGSAAETDTYYAVEWRSGKTPREEWRLAKDRRGNVKRYGTPEDARAVIRKKEAISSSLGSGGTGEFRVVKITVTKEAVEWARLIASSAHGEDDAPRRLSIPGRVRMLAVAGGERKDSGEVLQTELR